MALDLHDFETMAKEAVTTFWDDRELARRTQDNPDNLYPGEGGFTAAQNMTVERIIRRHGGRIRAEGKPGSGGGAGQPAFLPRHTRQKMSYAEC